MTQEEARELLSALILPRRAVTAEELSALERAAAAQCEYINGAGEGITSLSRSNDGASLGFTREPAAFGLCLAARAILRNAGLIKSGLPCAGPL